MHILFSFLILMTFYKLFYFWIENLKSHVLITIYLFIYLLIIIIIIIIIIYVCQIAYKIDYKNIKIYSIRKNK